MCKHLGHRLVISLMRLSESGSVGSIDIGKDVLESQNGRNVARTPISLNLVNILKHRWFI